MWNIYSMKMLTIKRLERGWSKQFCAVWAVTQKPLGPTGTSSFTAAFITDTHTHKQIQVYAHMEVIQLCANGRFINTDLFMLTCFVAKSCDLWPRVMCDMFSVIAGSPLLSFWELTYRMNGEWIRFTDIKWTQNIKKDIVAKMSVRH